MRVIESRISSSTTQLLHWLFLCVFNKINGSILMAFQANNNIKRKDKDKRDVLKVC